ncbi:AMP-binding protein [Thalassotalea psychrophila]|uniref:AMP-binding protein n=1 Tax=Thalassotalea psychrophila TaxID=3065647 RepID=A0ABY9U0D7_9GAMM|nr:AMP-binding protein [Colwelliaceae bacterium SQ149]
MSDLNILANRIYDWTQKQPDLDVLTFVAINSQKQIVDETRTYQQLWDNGQKLAAQLKQQGLEKGDSFGIIMANHPEFVELMVASSILGTTFVPIDPRTKGDKLKYMLDYAECKGAVVANYSMDNVNQAWQGRDNWIISLNDATSVLTATNEVPDFAVESDDPLAPMQLLYTSGTTGDPKAIKSSHIKFATGASVAAVLGITQADRPYTGLSLTHANAQIVTLGAVLTLGLRGVISIKFSKSRLWDITRQYGCTWFNLLGGMTTAIYADLPKDNDADNPVRIILSAGMPKAIWADFEQRFDVKLTEFYGAAEGGLTFNPAGAGPIGSCGKSPQNLEMKILNKDDTECAAGEPGQICFKNADGTTPVVEYFKNPEASLKKTQGGWLRMGDIGHVDENGWLYFHYRDGGGIRKNGDFINPAFIEKALSELDAVYDVFVYGVLNNTGGVGEKDVVAALVLNNEHEFNADSIFDYCKEKLETSFVPSFLQIVDQIPKTASEKPQERFLLDAFDENADNIYCQPVIA